MMTALTPLNITHQTAVYELLTEMEPWSIIPLDAFLHGRLNHPEHRWYGEYRAGRLNSVIYLTNGLVQITSRQKPRYGQLDFLIYRHLPRFILIGSKEDIDWAKQGLTSFTYQETDRSLFVVQSPLTTGKLLQHDPTLSAEIHIRAARPNDFNKLLQLYQGSEVESEVDPYLLQELLLRENIIVAENDQSLLGSAMCLKEGVRYILLGGLFVTPAARGKGVATALGKTILEIVTQKGKQACFYYRDMNMTPFYQRGAFRPIGHWYSYTFTSKATIPLIGDRWY